MATDPTNFLNIYSDPQKYTVTSATTQNQTTTSKSGPSELERTPEKDGFQKANPDKKPGLSGKQKGLIAAAVAVVTGIAVFCISKGKEKSGIKKAKQFFTNNLKEVIGNNNVLDDALSNGQKLADDLIKNNKKNYDDLLDTFRKTLKPADISEVMPDNIIYHGTSIDSAKNIFNKGATPFAATKAGSGKGLGTAIYTTPTLDAAKHYSKNGVVIPFKYKGGSIATLTEDQVEKIRLNLFNMIDIKDVKEAKTVNDVLFRKFFQDLGYDGVRTDAAITKGMLTGIFGEVPKFLDTAGQVAIFDGSKLEISKELLENLNPITANNYWRFINK